MTPAYGPNTNTGFAGGKIKKMLENFNIQNYYWDGVRQNMTYNLQSLYLDSTHNRHPLPPQHDTQADHQSHEPVPAMKIFGLTVLGILTVIMICGNLMSIITIISNHKIRDATYYKFVLNLACVDFLIATIIMPLYIVWEYNIVWPFDKLSCNFVTSIDIGLSNVSTYSIVLVALDKYLCITKPFTYHRIMTPFLCIMLITIFWIIWITYGFVAVFGKIAQDRQSEKKVLIDNCVFVMNPVYILISALLAFLIPFALMTFFGVRLYSVAWKHLNRLHISTMGSNMSGNTCTSTSDDSSQQGRHISTHQSTQENSNSEINEAQRNGKMTPLQEDLSVSVSVAPQTSTASVRDRRNFRMCKPFGTIVVVILCYFIMCAPYWIATSVDIFCQCVDPWIYEDILVVIHNLHSLVNPFIYITTDKKYRAIVKKTFFTYINKCRRNTRRMNTVTWEQNITDRNFT